MTTATAQQNGLLDAALGYAGLGYPVLPCIPGDKRPLTGHGLKDATLELDLIRQWWSNQPRANVAIRTDALIVVDVDGAQNRWPVDPDKAHDLLCAPLATTPRGGKHYIFRQPAGKHYRNTAGKVADYVDTRADGGYIVVSPSTCNGKAYKWQPGMELTEAPNKLPEPPQWLIDQLDALAGNGSGKPTAGQNIAGGQRNATLTSLAGRMRRGGMTEAEILAALLRVNADRCRPRLADREVAAVAQSISRYEPGKPPEAESETIEFQTITCAELVKQQFDIRFLVDRVLVAGQPCILAGPKKTLKTSILIDLGVSLAVGGFFLGKFRVPQAVTTAIMTGESGLATIKETILRICRQAGYDPAGITNLVVTDKVPQLASGQHLDAVRQLILDNAVEVLVIDPTYMCLDGVDAGNLFVQGRILRGISQLCQDNGVTLVLAHHFRKGGRRDPAGQYEPPELESIAWAGFQEFCRQWLLVNRRERYQPGTGEHRLWLAVGGSIGHGGLWGLDVDEGCYHDEDGRHWQATLRDADEVEENVLDRRENATEEAMQKKLQHEQRKVLEALAKYPEGETKSVLRAVAGLHSTRFNLALSELLRNGDAVPCDIFKSGKHTPHEGYKLAPTEDEN